MDVICETEETGRSNRLSGFDDFFWERLQTDLGVEQRLYLKPLKRVNTIFSKLSKKSLARLNSGLACGVVAGIGDPGRGSGRL